MSGIRGKRREILLQRMRLEVTIRLIDADALKVDMEEKVFCGDGTYKVFGYSVHQIDDAPSITPPPNDPLTL